jgi:hypothetical protein
MLGIHRVEEDESDWGPVTAGYPIAFAMGAHPSVPPHFLYFSFSLRSSRYPQKLKAMDCAPIYIRLSALYARHPGTR